MNATPGFSPARKLDGVSESATLKLNALVQAMKARGEDVANLTAGEPDYPVPDAAKRAVEESLKLNRSKYTAAAGIPELREAIARKTNTQQPRVVAKYGAWKGSDVIVTNGGKHAIFNAFMALLDAGDQVLIPSPYWLSYPDMAKVAGGTPFFIEAPHSQGFRSTVH
jgi:aspartate aminotransferase